MRQGNGDGRGTNGTAVPASAGGPGDIPRRLCAVAVELLPVTSASVSLHDEDMPVRLCESGAQAAYVTDIQATLGEGPCQSAARSGQAVYACDLTEGRDAERWPVFAEEATEAGVRATYSLPLGDDETCVGTLDLYRDTPGALTAAEQHTARALAEAVTTALMALARNTEELDQESGRADWLDTLVEGHDCVYQAVGMVMAQTDASAPESLALLRARAFADGRTVTEAARAVVAHELRFPPE